MKNKYILITICAFFTFIPLSAQFESPMKGFPSPQAASFGIYNEIPTNGYTGVPDVTIPIYELKHKEISIPINLSYHVASVKPNSHPSWVGLGWNLLAGGCITRKVNGYPDELQTVGGDIKGYFGHYSDLDKDDWYSDNSINSYLSKHEWSYEVTADEFSFNFCNYSGSFYMDHTGNWQVHSDADIKVIFDKEIDCINITDVRDNLQYGVNNYEAQGVNYRLINTITLVTPDGVQYKFGGIDATEYTIPYYSQNEGLFVATSWFLTQVTSPNGHMVTLSYTPADPIFEVKPLYTSMTTSGHSTGCLIKWNETCRDFLVILPVYLNKISIDDDRYIQFNSKVRNDLKLSLVQNHNNLLLRIENPKEERRETNWSIFYYDEDGDKMRPFFAKPELNTFKWRKLENIYIMNGSVNKQIVFGYDEYPQSNKRIRLKYFADYSLSADVKKEYQFKYYGENIQWPYYFTDQEDHWGFYNKSSELTGTIDKTGYKSHRDPAFELETRTSHMLSDIIYPTGGKTRFVYEKNDYSRFIDKNNVLTDWSTLSTGGIRVKDIIRYLNGKPVEIRNYYYLNDFTSLADTVKKKKSSGILAKEPSYTCTFKTNVEGVDYNYNFFSSGVLGPYLCNSNGSHIGYSNVIEVTKSGDGSIIGYKKMNFSNFGTDIWDNNHDNEFPLCRSKFDDYQMNYLTDKSFERGKLLSEEYYSANQGLKQKTLYKYSISPGQDYVRMLSVNEYYVGIYNGNFRVFFMMDAYKKYTYSYKLTERQTFKYGDTTDSYIASTDTYSYIDNNLLSKETHTIGNGFKKQTTYNYPKDYPRNPVYQQMVASNIITPVEIVNMLQSPKYELTFLSNELFTYAIQDGLPYLSSYKKAIKQQSDLAEYYRCHKIDSKGNPLHISLRGEPETVYIWSDNYLYPVAEIKNATYSQVQSAMAGVTDLTELYSALPEAQVTLFEFTADCQRTREQDPRGLNTYYKYNSFGWLKNILDHNSNILKQFDYGFSL